MKRKEERGKSRSKREHIGSPIHCLDDLSRNCPAEFIVLQVSLI